MWADTGTIGTSRRHGVVSASARISSVTACTRGAGTRSILLSATTQDSTPSSDTISRCSRVCGMTPSSAATTSSTRSKPLAPATMLCTKRSCPGTSTMPTRPTPSRSRCAKPRSMVMPRRFSSGSRSVSMPVRRRMSAVLPWSMCPAVPIIMAGKPAGTPQQAVADRATRADRAIPCRRARARSPADAARAAPSPRLRGCHATA